MENGEYAWKTVVAGCSNLALQQLVLVPCGLILEPICVGKPYSPLTQHNKARGSSSTTTETTGVSLPEVDKDINREHLAPCKNWAQLHSEGCEGEKTDVTSRAHNAVMSSALQRRGQRWVRAEFYFA